MTATLSSPAGTYIAGNALVGDARLDGGAQGFNTAAIAFGIAAVLSVSAGLYVTDAIAGAPRLDFTELGTSTDAIAFGSQDFALLHATRPIPVYTTTVILSSVPPPAPPEVITPDPAPRYIISNALPWGAPAPQDRPLRAGYRDAPAHDLSPRISWDTPQHRGEPLRAVWNPLQRPDRLTAIAWQNAQRVQRAIASGWGHFVITDTGSVVLWEAAFARHTQPDLRLPWLNPPQRDKVRAMPWHNAHGSQGLVGGEADYYDAANDRGEIDFTGPPFYAELAMPIAPLALGGVDGARLDFSLMGNSAALIDFGTPAAVLSATAGTLSISTPIVLSAPATTPPISTPRAQVTVRLTGPVYQAMARRAPEATTDAAINFPRLRSDTGGITYKHADDALLWRVARALDAATDITHGFYRPVQPGFGTPWHAQPAVDPDIPTFPALGVYTVNNTISVVRLPERTPVNVLGAQINMDLNSFAATASLTLAQQSDLDLLNPSINGADDVEININGFILVASMTSYRLSNAFGAIAWTISGSGRSVRLGPPYADPRSYTNTTLKSAAQLATDELSGSGWTLDWQVPDWNIDMGQFSYTNLTPIEAISTLAKAAGGTVQADPATQALHVISRYPVSPVVWSSTTPSVEIPSDVMLTLAQELKIAKLYNAIYISAGTQDVAINAKRAGTAGDQPLPAIVDPLILDSTVGQERARIEIDATGSRLMQAIALPIAAPVGVVLPGAFIQAGAALGIVNATSIVVQLDTKSGALDVQQQINLETLP